MVDRVTVYFDDPKLKEKIEKFCKQMNLSFSAGILKVSETGIDFFNITRRLDVQKALTEIRELQDEVWRLGNIITYYRGGVATAEKLEAVKKLFVSPTPFDKPEEKR